MDRDIWIFVRARDHKSFPGVGNFSYIWPHIFGQVGNFTAIFWKKKFVKSLPYALPSLAGLTLIGALVIVTGGSSGVQFRE